MATAKDKGGRRPRTSRVQGSMEYLMTYGWMIIAAVVALAILYQLGLFKYAILSPRAAPGSCEIEQDIIGGVPVQERVGACSGELPMTVATFSQAQGSFACMNATLDNANVAAGGYETVSFWMHWNGSPNQTMVGFPGYFLWLSDNGCIGFTTGNKDAYGVPDTGLVGGWHMVTAEFYNGTYATNSVLYIDGAPQNSYQCDNSAHTGIVKGDLLIGSSTGGRYQFTGSLSNMQVYDTALAASDIASLYNEGMGGAPVNLSNLVAWFPLNGNLKDYSGFNNTVTTSASCGRYFNGTYPAP